MTKEYKTKLISLAKEIQDIQETPIMSGKYDLLQQKVNYLIGYILALEEIDHD